MTVKELIEQLLSLEPDKEVILVKVEGDGILRPKSSKTSLLVTMEESE